MESPLSLITRIIGFFVLSALPLLNSPALAQDNTSTNEGVGKVLVDFGGISGGWVLNEHCKSLKRAERREFEWTYFHLNTMLQKELGRKVITQIQKAAAEVAQSEKHAACGSETVNLIVQSLRTARHMNSVLTNTPFDPDTSYQERLKTQFMTIETGLRIDAKCRHIPPSLVATIGRAHDAMIGYTIRLVGGDAVNKLLSDAEKATKLPEYQECGPSTKAAVHSASLGLRQLIERIEHDASLPE